VIERNQGPDELKHCELFELAIYIGAATTAALFYKSKDKKYLIWLLHLSIYIYIYIYTYIYTKSSLGKYNQSCLYRDHMWLESKQYYFTRMTLLSVERNNPANISGWTIESCNLSSYGVSSFSAALNISSFSANIELNESPDLYLLWLPEFMLEPTGSLLLSSSSAIFFKLLAVVRLPLHWHDPYSTLDWWCLGT
jgi:hypothetical protein